MALLTNEMVKAIRDLAEAYMTKIEGKLVRLMPEEIRRPSKKESD